jgi:cytochrome P450
MVDLVAQFAGPLPFAVLGELMGIDRDDQPRLAGWFRTLLAPYPGKQPPAEAVDASNRIVGFLIEAVDARWESPTEDLIGDLVLASRAGDLNRSELLSTVFQLMVAGHDTTTSLIGNGVAALLTHPAQRDALAADLTLVPRAVEEFAWSVTTVNAD